VIHAEEIALFYGLKNEDLFVLLAAAWFHDLGHLFGSPANHEHKSATLMRSFLENSYPDEVLEKISNTILATRELSTPRHNSGKSFVMPILIISELMNFC